MNSPAHELERLTDECLAAGVLAEFACMMAAGTAPRAAAMYALQTPPGSRHTDRAFCQGARRQMESMPEVNRKAIVKLAKSAGIATDGKFYKGSLGSYTDPAAWVTCADDVLTVCKARNLDCEGVIKHRAALKDEPPKPVDLAPHLARRLEREYLKRDPRLAAKVKASAKAKHELREMVVAKHGKPARKRGRLATRLRCP
jgi:hypothetical protein